ncbi:MAG: tryptophan-rich sensory protein [Anaerolineales bacterium]
MIERARPWLVLAAVLATLAVNGLANALPLNGVTTGEVSDRFDSLFVPAGYVFSIWGLIYLGLIGFATYQALPAQRDNPRLRATFAPFLLASTANIAWIFLWHYQQFLWTLVAMVTLLVSLIVIYSRLQQGKGYSSRAEFWFARLPFSIYLGWVSIATIANTADVISLTRWSGFGLSDVFWAVAMLIIGLALAVLMVWQHRDGAFALVFLWAYIGIGVAQQDTAAVAIAAFIGAALLAMLAVAAPFAGRRNGKPTRLFA